MSQIQSYVSALSLHKDVGTLTGDDAPIWSYNATKGAYEELDLTVAAPVDPGTGNPTPVAAFESLPNLELFMDAANIDGAGGALPAQGAVVRNWSAKAGGLTFASPVVAGESQAVSDLRAPNFYAADATNPNFLRFSGGNRMGVASDKVKDKFTIYVIARYAHLGYGTMFSAGNTSNTNPAVVLDCNSDGTTRAFRRTNDGSITIAQQPLIANAWRVFAITSADYSALSLRANERAASGVASVVSQAITPTDMLCIGGRVSQSTAGGYSSLAKFDIAALVIFSTNHDATTRNAVEKELATRYKITLPSQGGTIDGDVSKITAHRLQLSQEYGIPATHALSGLTLPGFHNSGPNPAIKSTEYEYFTGTYNTKAIGEVITKKWINGNVKIKHAGVQLVDCIVYGTVDPKVDTRDQPVDAENGVVNILRCEIFGKENDSSTGVGYIRYTIKNSFLHDSEDNVRLNKNCVIENNLMAIHSNGFLTETERLHTDCVQSNGGDNAVGERSYVRYNTLIAQRHNLTKGNSAIILATEGASVNGVNQGSPLRRVTCEHNYLAGGSYSLYIKTMGTSGSPGVMEDIVFNNNVFRGTDPGTTKLPSGAFAQVKDAWIPYDAIANQFLTMTGNVREVRDSSGVVVSHTAITIDKSTAGSSELG